MVITLGAPRVLGVVYGDMLEVEAPLSSPGLDWPDEEWLTLFRGYGDFPGDLEEPRLEHGKLRFEARDEDLRRAWAAIEERVRATNRVYDASLPPRDRAEQRVEDARRDDVEDRIRNAQQLLDSLYDREGEAKEPAEKSGATGEEASR
ncbi:MAG TPA: hypothetical protein VE596_19690 [Gaiellaceae bacterium]|nr:hypothetical protein [Gaiellaceae bacterium]